MGGVYVHGRERDYLLTSDMTEFFDTRPLKSSLSATTDVAEYYDRPEPKQGNRQQRRAKAAQERRKRK
jgi:hypothetical protein